MFAERVNLIDSFNIVPDVLSLALCGEIGTRVLMLWNALAIVEAKLPCLTELSNISFTYLRFLFRFQVSMPLLSLF